YNSSDAGQTWDLVYVAPSNVGRMALAISASAPRKVWALLESTTNARFLALVVYDDDAGTSSLRTATGLYTPGRGDFGAQSWYNLVLALDPADSSTVYIGGVRLYRSIDGGSSFVRVAYNTHVDWHALEFAPSDPTVMIGGNDGGVHVSYDRGNTFISRNTNIAITQFYAGLAVHPTQQDVLAGGLQDNSSLFAFGSGFWTYVSGGDGGYAAFNPADPSVFWTSCQNAGCIFRTTRAANGNGLAVFSRGFSPGDTRKRFLPPLVLDPNQPTTLYYATYRLYRTTNDGAPGSWILMSGDLTKGSGFINTVAVAPSDSRVIWVGTSDGNVQVSADQGTTFTIVSSGLPNRVVTDIVVDAQNASRALVTYSGFGTPHAYLTSDQGATWRNITGNLPDLPFNAGVVIPGTDRFFVAGDVGVYETTDAGTTWSSAFVGIPNVVVTDLVLQQATGTLYAGTFGRGIFATTIATGTPVLRGDVNRDGQVNALDALLVQQALVGIAPSGSPNPMPNGDANCNGVLDSSDAVLILQFAVGNAPAAACVGTPR
ncbi:MAG: dockerin type I domain-containing protein, partial [Gemmatimonadaceae bacterium]